MSPLFGEDQSVELFEWITKRVSYSTQCVHILLMRLQPELFATPEQQDAFSAARYKRIEELYRLLRTDPNVVKHSGKEAHRVAKLLWKHTAKLGEDRDRIVQIF